MSSESDARGPHPKRSHPLRETRALCDELDALAREMQQAEINGTSLLQGIGPLARASACNLIHYLAFRRHDLRHLQSRLTALGLSSLGRSEAGILESVNAVRGTLQALEGDKAPQADATADHAGTQNLLTEHAQSLLGPAPAHRSVRIMVTMPAEAADDYTLVHDLVKGGMDCMRINCAHDDRAAWSRMIAHLRRASEALGRPCQVAMDLAGPKLRTGPLRPGPAVVKIRPERDVFGRVTALARVWLTTDSEVRPPPSTANASLPVAVEWLNALKMGDHLDFEDARGAARTLRVIDVTADGVWTETGKTAYVVPGMRLYCREIEADGGFATVGDLPPRVEPVILAPGDHLVVTRSLEPGRPATRDSRGQLLTPAFIGCTLPEAFDYVRPGDSIWFDDGKIGGVVERIEPDRVTVKITRARERGGKLLSDKGINLPDSALKLPALTKEDVADLEFVVKNADIVSLSFANSASDVELLHEHLKRLGGEKLGVILKIETRRGFENLPEMLFAALHFKRCGVMIARGDLAVECGFERLAEVQEEILWICEAAHVPVIWATQVLESLAKEGFPSRAEITDAAMSERAECVMLNKGPHICAALAALDDILRRMQTHVTKKRSTFRSLRLADRFFSKRGMAAVHAKAAPERPSAL
jgi:pyruvate kinase